VRLSGGRRRYRFCAAGQLARLNRVIALKDLGFTLDQVRAMLDQQVSASRKSRAVAAGGRARG